MFGPVILPGLPDLPQLNPTDRLAYLGKRRGLVGGRADADDDDDDDVADAEDEEVEEQDPTSVTLMHHLLPITVITDLMTAYNVRHVIDLCPTPLPLILAVVEKGCCYFGLCATEFQREYPTTQLKNVIIAALSDPKSPLSENRFSVDDGSKRLRQCFHLDRHPARKLPFRHLEHRSCSFSAGFRVS